MKILYTIAIVVMSVASTATMAWVDPISFNKDNGDEIETATKTVAGIDRCDTAVSAYPLNLPDTCHRWGLVWDISHIKSAEDWEPGNTGDGYRLPTIKELVKLFDYSGGTGFAINELINKKLGTVSETRWLLSSSYRDIDTRYDVGNNDELQIFAINTLTGEVRAFEPGEKGGSVDPGPYPIISPQSDDGLSLCVSLNPDGECSLDDSHSYYTLLVRQVLLEK